MLGRRLRTTPTCPQRCAGKVCLTSPSCSPASRAPRLRCTRWLPPRTLGQEDLSEQRVVVHQGTAGTGAEPEPRSPPLSCALLGRLPTLSGPSLHLWQREVLTRKSVIGVE